MIGLVLAGLPFLLGASGRLRSGVLEVAFADPGHALARWLLRLPYAAITFGHVVLAPSHRVQDALRAHERAHVAQYEIWGPVFLVAYPLSSLAQVFRGRRAHADNHFELQARAWQSDRIPGASCYEAPSSGAGFTVRPVACRHGKVHDQDRATRPT